MKNSIIQSIETIVKSHNPTYVWGGGKTARNLTRFYKLHGVILSGYLVDKKYFKQNEFIDGKKIECLQVFLDQTPYRINLIVAHESVSYDILCTYDLSNVDELFCFDYSGAFAIPDEINIWDEEFWEKNKSKFIELRNSLYDVESKHAFDSFAWQRRSSYYFKGVCNGQQYFPMDLLCFEDREFFIDCGGYDGDTTIHFLELAKTKGVSDCTVALLEPDQYNYNKCLANLEAYNQVKLYKCGAWNKRDILHFATNGVSSMVQDDGELTINVESLDDLFYNESPTFIKMDVEGAEMMALNGARDIIARYKPKLAICVYHRKNDILDVFSYLLQLVPSYRFALRNYSTCSLECVLYAF